MLVFNTTKRINHMFVVDAGIPVERVGTGKNAAGNLVIVAVSFRSTIECTTAKEDIFLEIVPIDTILRTENKIWQNFPV